MRQRLVIVLCFVLLGSEARSDTIVLANGDTLTGEIVEWAVDHLVIEHEQLGTIRLSLDQLKLDTGKPPSRGLFDTGFLRGWKRTASFGMNGEAGESMTRQGGLNSSAGSSPGATTTTSTRTARTTTTPASTCAGTG